MKRIGLILLAAVLTIIAMNVTFFCLSAPSTILNVIAVAVIFIWCGFISLIQKYLTK